MTALAKACGVRMSRGLRSSSTIARCGRPPGDAFHILSLLAATGVEPGSAMPSASQATCMVFAVPMPEQTPGPRIATSLIARISSTVTLPKARPPAVANMSSMSTAA